jgi:microsomal dipeptidase-like Zn-dependent dipeptidase
LLRQAAICVAHASVRSLVNERSRRGIAFNPGIEVEKGTMNYRSPQDSTPRVPLGGDYWRVEPDVPLWGFADLHAHFMAHLAFGGNGFWGRPYDPEHPDEEGMKTALASCEPAHGGLLNINPEFGHPAGGGWPDFEVWPRFTTLVHQQAYVDWIHRAYLGGLRLASCLAVNNELLGSRSEAVAPYDDRSAISTQIAGMKKMVQFVDETCGGPGQGWMQIAYTPADARRIIGENKLAIVLGVEVDSLGNWRRLEDLEQLTQSDLEQARRLIAAELDWLYELGVRQITPIHLTDNAFGGTAIYMRFLEVLNVIVTGRHYETEDGWDTGIRYRLEYDGGLVGGVQRAVAGAGPKLSPRPAMNRRSLMYDMPGAGELEQSTAPAVRGRSHANVRGLTVYGAILLEEMRARGMIIDVDHMSQKALDTTLDLMEPADYPVISSHSWFRELAFTGDQEFDPEKPERYPTGDVHKVAHENAKRGDQVERIAALGGVIAPILSQGDVEALDRVMPQLKDKVAHPCPGSGTAWAQAYLYVSEKTGGRGVAIGSDINGAADLPGPRFGPLAAYDSRHDPLRVNDRRAEMARQANGVRYDEPIRDYRWFRFDESGAGGYDEEECDVWEGIAEYKAGFNPDAHEHPPEDLPEMSLKTFYRRLEQQREQGRIDNVARGLWAYDEAERAGQEPDSADWLPEQRAAYLVRRGSPPGEEEPDAVAKWFRKIRSIWDKWSDMDGDNPPMARCKAGPRRDFDVNIDGMAHYGLLPDLLQDMRNAGLAVEDFAPLFRGAEDYVRMWEKCEERAAGLDLTTNTE